MYLTKDEVIFDANERIGWAAKPLLEGLARFEAVRQLTERCTDRSSILFLFTPTARTQTDNQGKTILAG